MVKLATHDYCTGCGACAFRCPKGCITMLENHLGIVLPKIDKLSCIKCHACEKVCPVLNELKCHKARKAYAAWSLDDEERHTSASGGIAAEMYKTTMDMGYKIVGAVQLEDFSVEHEMSDSKDAIPAFKNSKYVFSTSYKVYGAIKEALYEKQKVLFIGLPCQVAALRKLFKDDQNLLLVEVVCHGTPPFSYLRQHIEMLNKNTGNVTKRMSFRDPCMSTTTYTFTLYNVEKRRFYAKRTKDGDTYQFGFHRAVSYRENCYHCRFAKPERNADITIGDYHGLGLVKPAIYDAKNVSLILENTDEGHSLLKRMLAEKRITADLRPLREPFEGEPQLRHPSLKNKYRTIFENEMEKHGGDFEKAILRSQRMYMRDRKYTSILAFPKRIAKEIIRAIGIK